MKSTPNIGAVASLIGEASRATILMGLLGGIALPASELARLARITPQTASSHLAKLVEGGLLVQESYGRHRYYRLANPEVGQALEALNVIAPAKPIQSLRESDLSQALQFARACYDHLAGKVGVALTVQIVERGLMDERGRDFVVTPNGAQWFKDFGIDLEEIRKTRRHLARKCLDWSERRHHMAGALGASFTHRLLELGWIERVPGGRAIDITQAGFHGFVQEFGITFERESAHPDNFRQRESVPGNNGS